MTNEELHDRLLEELPVPMDDRLEREVKLMFRHTFEDRLWPIIEAELKARDETHQEELVRIHDEWEDLLK